jgi:DNA-binding response OmpR family regulator
MMTEKGTILLVEDEVSIRKAAQMYLEHVGFRVVSTGLAVDVLPLARQECPDLIVLDLSLPDGDGMEVSRMCMC